MTTIIGQAQETATGALHSLATRAENRTLIADAGGIELLIPLFDGGSAETKAEVESALLTLAIENPSNQFNIASKLVAMIANGPDDAREATTAVQQGRVEAQEHATRVIYTMSLDRKNRDALSRTGAIAQLVRQLKGGSDKAQVLASNALSQIARISGDLRIQVTQQLVTLLGSSNADVRQRAGTALRDDTSEGGEDKKHQREAAMAGGVGPLVELLKAGLSDDRVEAQEYSLWSLSMTTDITRRKHMVEEGCIPPLVQSLKSGKLSADSQEHAAMVLACLSIDTSNHEAIIERDGIRQMVALLSGEDKTLGAKKQAALGLSRLANYNAETQERIVKGGGITPLVQWLIGGDNSGPPDVAARALAAIARENEHIQMWVAEAGAIPPLVQMLDGFTDIDSHVAACSALATLARGAPSNQVSIAEAGGIPPLVELLLSSRMDCQENASNAIAMLAENEDNKLQVLRAGGIGPLVALLSIGNDATKQYTAKALHFLARDVPEIQATLAHEGASKPLTTLLASDENETQESAVGALLCLASHPDSRVNVVKRLVGVLLDKNTAAQLKAAEALAVLAARNSLNRATIVQAGAIEPLVGLLGNGQRADQNTPPERAAAVLADLARIGESKVEIARAGGIGPLVNMLSSSFEDSQTHAACALRYLSVTVDNKVTITSMGGISRFVTLLSSGTLEGQRHAAHALWQLAVSADSKAAVVQAGGIPALVALMLRADPDPEEVSKEDQRAHTETKESAAAVLSELARSQGGNRMAIVQQGGITPIVNLIREGSQVAQKHATCALWGLAQEPRFRPSIVETEGAVERLVELLRNFEGETQGFAAATLVCLVQDESGKATILSVGGPGPLMTIALGPANWLRSQCIDVLKMLGYPDPTENRATATSPPASPRFARYRAELAENPAIWMVMDEPVKQPINDEHMSDIARKIKAGDRVLVDPGSRRAEVRFVGKIPEIALGYWIGVQYDEAVGKNDGSVKGHRCFECAAEYGGFLRPDHIRADPDPPARKPRRVEEEEGVASATAGQTTAASADGKTRKKRGQMPDANGSAPSAQRTPRADSDADWDAAEDAEYIPPANATAPALASSAPAQKRRRTKSKDGAPTRPGLQATGTAAEEATEVTSTDESKRRPLSAKGTGKDRASREKSTDSRPASPRMSPRASTATPRVSNTPRAASNFAVKARDHSAASQSTTPRSQAPDDPLGTSRSKGRRKGVQ